VVRITLREPSGLGRQQRLDERLGTIGQRRVQLPGRRPHEACVQVVAVLVVAARRADRHREI